MLFQVFVHLLNIYLEKFKDNKSHKEYYSHAYYNTLILEENRINPILKQFQISNINSALEGIIERYSNINKTYNIANIIRLFIKNILLSVILIVIFYQKNIIYIHMNLMIII